MHNYYLCTISALSLSSTHDMMTRWSFSNGKRSQHVTAGWMAAWMNGVEDYYCTLFVFVYTIVCTHGAKSMGMAASYSSLVTTCTAQRSQCSIFSSPQHHHHHHHLTTSRGEWVRHQQLMCCGVVLWPIVIEQSSCSDWTTVTLEKLRPRRRRRCCCWCCLPGRPLTSII